MRKSFLLIVPLIVTAILLMSRILPVDAQGQPGNIWVINFYNNSSLQGGPVYTFNASDVSFNWGSSSPGPGVPASSFSVRMTSSIYFPAGTYTFYVTSGGATELYINGQLYLDAWSSPQPGKNLAVDVQLAEGNSILELDYSQNGGPAYVSLGWLYISPATAGGPTPTPYPLPVSASSVTTNYGNYTPCIQQNLPQSSCFQSNGAWNAPNLGSIQMEPNIVIWGNCTADQVMTMPLYVGQPPQLAKCSKTGAGWYPLAT